jgi:chromosome condensin MukBEF MukE localization factor
MVIARHTAAVFAASIQSAIKRPKVVGFVATTAAGSAVRKTDARKVRNVVAFVRAMGAPGTVSTQTAPSRIAAAGYALNTAAGSGATARAARNLRDGKACAIFTRALSSASRGRKAHAPPKPQPPLY